MIEVKRLSLSFTKEYYALCNINLVVEEQERVAIVGESGSGKTTLLRAIAGLEPFTKGEIFINGQNLKSIDFSQDISLGYVSYKPVFFNNKTVLENLKYVLKIRKIDEINAKIKLNQVLKQYNIETIKHLKIKQLSQYQKIAVQLARLSLRKIDIYLIDNIFKNLTKTENKQVIVFIKELQKQPVTFLITTKDIEIAKELSNRIIQLKLGSIILEEKE